MDAEREDHHNTNLLECMKYHELFRRYLHKTLSTEFLYYFSVNRLRSHAL